MIGQSVNILADLNQIVESWGISELYARIIVAASVFIIFLVLGFI